MNTDWLQSFFAAAKHHSFSKAAKASNLSQPALSKHIRHLEQDLGVLLFHRTAMGIDLTEAGAHFYKRMLPVFTDLGAVRQEMKGFSRKKPIVIGSLPSLATYYLPARIKGRQFMGRPVKLMIQNTSDELLQSLQEDRLDAVVADSTCVMDSLWQHVLFTEEYHAVFPIGHRFQHRQTISLTELLDEPMIVHEAPCDTRKRIVKQTKALGKEPNIVSEVNFGDFIFGAVTAGMGVTIIPEIVAKHLGHQQLFTLPLTDFGEKRTISLVAKSKIIGTELYDGWSSLAEEDKGSSSSDEPVSDVLTGKLGTDFVGQKFD
ncbi:LysR family transcriptional regulator [Bacillaceae bacterium SIJ1]|uniref:LysR family transcriptional regulator n=1 Tax=Litoribacterium kuwaitense TaxID=1398745 RepID=UPI0013E9DF8A|nr:LysR family transcriptional regulator [Litoribacterium kuwaitense]NGP46210.1 LysR family transcriptional regulator [Litoribacterium kuwaitense]